jgi:hypothetical protein
LSKLDRQNAGETTACSIIKSDTDNGPYSQTVNRILVTAVEDKEYYSDREAGEIHPSDADSKCFNPGYQFINTVPWDTK